MKLVYEDIVLKESKKSFHYFRVEEDYLAPFWHYHPELELTLIYEGNGTRFVGDSILPYEPFDLVLVGENLPHHWVSVNTSDKNPQKAIVIQFSSELFASFPELSILFKLFQEAERGIHFKEPSKDILQLLLEFDHVSSFEQFNALLKILHDLIKHENRSILSTSSYKNQLVSEKNQNKIAKTTSFILENLDQRITVEMMAEITHLVPQSFCRWFKSATGNTFVNYLNKARIEKACQLLINTKLAISDICFSVGFDSLSHFNRTFLKLKEKSPREYRKSVTFKS